LTFAAGYLGLSAGVALLAGISTAIGEGSEESMFLNPSVDIGVGVVSLVILVVAGLFAGFIPAKRAISIPTVDALRTEL
jgi:putative ABC transport system permease protein